MIVRDVMFYLAGYVYGVPGTTAYDAVELYREMQVQNQCLLKVYQKKIDLEKMEKNPKLDVEYMRQKHLC